MIDLVINEAVDSMMTKFHRDIRPCTPNAKVMELAVESIVAKTYGKVSTLLPFCQREAQSQFDRDLMKMMQY